jgi:hypothetical protein
MSDHRLSQGDARGDAARLLHAAARERLKVAVADLFLPAQLRLSEWHRTTMTALLDRLIGTVEDDLRLGLARVFPARTHEALHAALTSDHVPIAQPILADAETLRDPSLVSLLLRRVEEHRLNRATAISGAADALLLELVHDQEEQVAEAAMAVLVAQNRRLDRFQEPLLPSPELSAELEHRLVWSVAGALRAYLIERHGISADAADDALAVAATKRLSTHDEGDSLEARCLRLASLLDGFGRLDDAFIARALPEAGLSLLLAALAQRCDLAPDSVWEIVSEPIGRGLPLLLRAAGLGRAEAGAILVAMGTPGAGDEDARLVRQLDLFDSMSLDDARRTLRLWRADPLYRVASQDPAP